MFSRLEADMHSFAKQFNTSTVATCLFVRDAAALVADRSDGLRAYAEAQLELLLKDLVKQRDADSMFVREALPLILAEANTVELSAASGEQRRARELHTLRQLSQQEDKP